jgi:hypothetical protein
LFRGAGVRRAPCIVAVWPRFAVLSESISVEILTTRDYRIGIGIGIGIGIWKHLTTAASGAWILSDFAAVVTAIGSQQQGKQKHEAPQVREL